MKYLFLLICLGIINSEIVKEPQTVQDINNEKMQTQQPRQLWGGLYGGYHPFYNPTLSQYAVNHQVHPTHSESTHVQKHIQPHNPYMDPYGMGMMNPMMMGGMMNPMMMGMMNPMMMGMMNPMMNPMMMGMMNPMMNPMMMGGMYGMMGHGMTHTTTEQEANSPQNEGSEQQIILQNILIKKTQQRVLNYLFQPILLVTFYDFGGITSHQYIHYGQSFLVLEQDLLNINHFLLHTMNQ